MKLSYRKKNKFTRKLLKAFAIFFLIALFTEFSLRYFFGFCDAVLMRADPDYEYIPLPQKRFRFGNNIFYNSFSQRNPEISKQDSVILGFGDSVINGGTQTDQDSLATTRLSKYLTNKYSRNIIVTNISAGSWGPDNCYAYLKKNGNFGAKKILLVVSSHDAYDNMEFMPVVGINPDCPDHQYLFAIQELFDRYIIPRYLKKSNSDSKDILNINKKKEGMLFNSGFKNFKHYSDSAGISILIYLHAEKNELLNKSYNDQGKEIIEFCKTSHITLIKELDYNFTVNAYRDNIHLNSTGQRLLFDVLKTNL